MLPAYVAEVIIISLHQGHFDKTMFLGRKLPKYKYKWGQIQHSICRPQKQYIIICATFATYFLPNIRDLLPIVTVKDAC